jgi:tetratricopeptide (TPR) repeat protein
VIDYTGQELRLEVAGRVERTIPADQVLRIETATTQQQAAADAAMARGDFSTALALYREARKAESREWVRRGITAQLVWCYQALGQTEQACAEFLVLIQSDPETPYFSCIPLAWVPSPPSVLLEQSAGQWIKSQMPAAVLLAASHLLSTGARPAAQAKLQELTTHSDRRIALLAVAQTWRPKVVTAGDAQLAGWRNTIESMPEPLRAGPYYVLGLGWRQRRRWEQAVLAFLRIPILYREHHVLASRALWEAGQLLEKLERNEEAVRLYRELVADYPRTPSVSQARSRLEEFVQNQKTTGR